MIKLTFKTPMGIASMEFETRSLAWAWAKKVYGDGAVQPDWKPLTIDGKDCPGNWPGFIAALGGDRKLAAEE